MTLALVSLLHGEAHDILYFWSSILMVLLPIGVFTWLTYLLVKKYRQEMREKKQG
jgi:uncharacterized membrane protein YdfJ with MMPL/SSD domain